MLEDAWHGYVCSCTQLHICFRLKLHFIANATSDHLTISIVHRIRIWFCRIYTMYGDWHSQKGYMKRLFSLRLCGAAQRLLHTQTQTHTVCAQITIFPHLRQVGQFQLRYLSPLKFILATGYWFRCIDYIVTHKYDIDSLVCCLISCPIHYI